MATTKPTTYLRRYTDLPALLYLLREQQITLLDPKSWDDSNDSHYLSQYKEKKKLKSVLALCFSQTPETYHHWRVFSSGPSGVCILFNRDPLVASLRKQRGVKTQDVEYLTLNNARKRTFRTSELPFIKRAAFKPESEFRAVFESTADALPSINIAIDLSCIRSISLSPWLHKSLAPAATAAIRSVDGCEQLKVSRSTLIANEEWKSIAARAT
jgi:hypothetical protein